MEKEQDPTAASTESKESSSSGQPQVLSLYSIYMWRGTLGVPNTVIP